MVSITVIVFIISLPEYIINAVAQNAKAWLIKPE